MLKSKLAKAISLSLKPQYLVMTLLATSTSAFSSEQDVNKDTTEDEQVTRVVGIKQTLTSNIAQSTMRSEADLSTVPRSVQVINAEVIEQQDASSLSDVVHNVSNVAEDNNFGGTRDLFKIRGFKANVFEDGTRVYGLAQDKAVIEDLESVEVVKGPESVLYGNMSPGGLINLISKRPTPISQNQVKVAMDEHGKQRLSVDFSGPANDDGTVLYRLVGVFDDSESWRDASDSKQVFIAPSLSWLVTGDTTLTFSYKYNKEELPFDRGTLAVRNNNDGWDFLDINKKRLGTDFSRQEREVHKFGFDIDHDINDYWSMRFKARNYQRKASAERVHFYASSNASMTPYKPRGAPFAVPLYQEDKNNNAFDGNINRYINGSNQSSNTQLYSLENNIEFNTGSIEHRAIIGADYTRYKEEERQSASASWSKVDLAPYAAYALRTPNTHSGRYNYYTDDPSQSAHPNDMYDIKEVNLELTEYSVFAQDLIKYDDWSFVLGARYDIFESNNTETWDKTFMAKAKAIGVPLKNSSSKSPKEKNISVQAGALYKLNRQVSLFGNFTDSYLPNQKFDSVAKKWVKAQNGRQFEIGSKLSLLDHRLNLTTSVFRTDLKNVAYAGDIKGSYDVYKQESQGFEIDGDYAITDDLVALFSYGYTDVEFVDAPDSVNKPVNVPKNNASLWLTYQASNEWGVGSGVRYVDDRAGNRRKDYDYTLDAYTLVDAAIWYAPDFADNDLKLQLNVKNLFDKDYYTAGSDSTQNAVYLGSPRTVSLSAVYNF